MMKQLWLCNHHWAWYALAGQQWHWGFVPGTRQSGTSFIGCMHCMREERMVLSPHEGMQIHAWWSGISSEFYCGQCVGACWVSFVPRYTSCPARLSSSNDYSWLVFLLIYLILQCWKGSLLNQPRRQSCDHPWSPYSTPFVIVTDDESKPIPRLCSTSTSIWCHTADPGHHAEITVRDVPNRM